MKKTFLYVLIGCFVALVGADFYLLATSQMKVPDASEIASFHANKAWVIWLLTAPLGASIALVFAYVFFQQMKKEDPGNDRMQKIALAVRTGAFAYLRQQYTVVAWVFFVLCLVLSILAFYFEVQFKWVPIAFLTGGFFSGLCGFLGMNCATLASNRTTNAAQRSINDGLRVAIRAGAVMGLVVVGLGLLDIAIWFLILNNVLHLPLNEVTISMLAFGMGASTQALFARVGGGIYTKAADVGSDLAGKVEAGIPEDDPRNAGVIADNVGDNVGDVAGMGADLYESYCGAILSTAALGFAVARSLMPGVSADEALPWVMLPMAIAGVGNVASVAGVYFVRTEEKLSLKVLMAALFRGINGATIITAMAALGLCYLFLNDASILAGSGCKSIDFGGISCKTYVLNVWLAIVSGLVAGWIIGKATEYYTSNDFKPTQEVAKQALTGPATVIIDGIALGMLSSWIPVLSVGASIFLSFWLCNGFTNPISGLYGVSIAAVGMLSTLGITLATDAYGPIADNAGGNAQMSKLDPSVRERTDALDALGNTTAATGKGFAIGSAALTALALLAAYVEEIRGNLHSVQHHEYIVVPKEGATQSFCEVCGSKGEEGTECVVGQEKKAADGATVVAHKESRIRGERRALGDIKADSKSVAATQEKVPAASIQDFMDKYGVNLMNPSVLIGAFIGAMMVFVFCALTLKAVGRAAGRMVFKIIEEFRRPGVMEERVDPDYAGCVQIATAGAQREMIVPSMLAIIVPVGVGLLLGVSGVMGLLVGALSTGFVTAIMMAASGGAWDNAKKWIESGAVEGHGKHSGAHKAAVVGDTVGDPFKDTSGPSLNILIKLMSMVSIVFVGLTLTIGEKLFSLLK